MPVARSIASAFTLALASTVFFTIPAAAEGISVPTDTVVVAEPGSSVELGRTAVDTTLAGPDCTWTASAQNQESVHFGNNIVIRSGGRELTLGGVEDTPHKVTSSSGSAYLTQEIVAVLQMGPDGVFSGGINLTISYDNCQPELPTTLLPTTLPPTTLPPTTVEPTIVSEPTTSPPVDVDPQGPSTTMVPTTPVPTTPVPTSAGPPATEVAATPVLPVTGSDWPLLLGVIGSSLLAAGFALTRRVRVDGAARG